METTVKPKIESADPALRKFGRIHDKPCADKAVITCTLWECQRLNRCQKQ